MGMGPIWSAQETATLEDMMERGCSYSVIADALPGRTANGCALRAKFLGLRMRPRKEPTPDARDPRVASILHLVDLKRAGHSPTRTETHVPAQSTYTPPRPLQYSPWGSPAAACEESV